ncbi:MAG: hypothetical protein RQ756_08535, partial [Flavobacteriaceae bacterium]|nr:hypothetical protein [Flavobacteriaceae bacterium]
TSARGNRLGFGKSDENGNFSIVSLARGTGNFSIRINALSIDDTFEYQPGFISPSIFFTDGTSLTNPLFDFGEITIFEQSQLEFSIVKTSTVSATLDWTLSFQEANCLVEINNQEEINNLSVCDQVVSTSGTQTDSTPNFNDNFQSLRFTSATFTYSLNGASPISQNILLDQTNNTFSFEY